MGVREQCPHSIRRLHEITQPKRRRGVVSQDDGRKLHALLLARRVVIMTRVVRVPVKLLLSEADSVRSPPCREQPANPDRRCEKSAEGQPCHGVEPMAPKAAVKHGAESRERGDVDGDRQIGPA